MTIVLNAPVPNTGRAANGARHTARPSRPAARSLEPMPNWMKLSRKDDVEIYRHGELVASGRVDMLALDGSVFWVIRNDGLGRAMFLHSDGFTVLRLPRARPAD